MKKGWFSNRWSAIGSAILVTAGVAGLAWANLAEPRIDKKIDAKCAPIVDALEYQNCMMIVSMPDSLQEKARQLYLSCQRARGACR